MDILDYMLLPKDQRQLHLKLDEECTEGRAYEKQLLKSRLAALLDTTVPTGKKIHCAHACNYGGCINLHHVYFGTPKENQADGKDKREYYNTNRRVEVFVSSEVKTMLEELAKYYNTTLTSMLEQVVRFQHEEITKTG